MKSIFTAAMWLSSGILLGRIAGFFREILFASRFGVSQEADLVVFAFTLPDFLIQFLIGGALSAVLIPEFKRLSPDGQQGLFVRASLSIGIIFLLIAALLAAMPSLLVILMAPGFDPETTALAETMARWVVLAVPLTGLAGVTTAYLQSRDSYSVPALGTLILNLTVIFALILLVEGPTDFRIVAEAILIGALLRWISQLFCLPKGTWRGFQNHYRADPGLFRRYLQALGAGGLLFLIPLIGRALASLDGPGGLATLNYAFRLAEAPKGILLGSVAVALFPKISEFFTEKREDEGIHLARHALRLTWILTLPWVIFFLLFYDPLVTLVYQWGEMSSESVRTIGLLTAISALNIPAGCLYSILVAVTNAKRDTWLPFICSACGFLAFLPLGWAGLSQFGLPGLVLAMVLIDCGLLLVLNWKLGHVHRMRLLDGSFVRETGEVSLIPIALGIVLWAILEALSAGIILKLICSGLYLILATTASLYKVTAYRREIHTWLRNFFT